MKDLLKLISGQLQNEEDRRRLARKLLNDESDLTTQVAFIHKKDGEPVSLKQLVEREGMEKAEEMLMGMLESLANSTDVQNMQLSIEEANEILEKVRNGEATSEEEQIAKVLSSTQYAERLKEDNSTNMMHLIIQMCLDLIRFAYAKVHYAPQISDFMMTMQVLASTSLSLTPSSVLSKYKDHAPNTMISMGNQIKEDMQKCCEQNIWAGKYIQPEYVVLGLIAWLNEILCAQEWEIPRAEELGDALGIKMEPLSGEEDEQKPENPGVVQPICHGSNNDNNGSKVLSFENKAMKNMLKDD